MDPEPIGIAATSLFSRVTRYVAAERGNPRENRLTEVVAGVLERVPGLARSLAELWLDPQQGRAHPRERAASATYAAWERLRRMAHDGRPLVSTQVHVRGGIVDLALRFSTDTGARVNDVVVWIEVKHGIEPHSEQLATYQKALALDHLSRGGAGAVVLLDRLHNLPYEDHAEAPPEIAQRSWQETARHIHQFEAPDSVSAWLCHELLFYLQEENLMTPAAIGPEHLTALAYAGEANRALEEICERTEHLVTSQFRKADDTHSRYGEGYWASWGDGTWLEWHVLRKGHYGPLEVRAGLCAYRRTQFEPEVERQLGQGIQISDDLVAFDRWQGPSERLMRVARPQDVLVGAGLDAQANSLANWVVATLTAVEATAAAHN